VTDDDVTVRQAIEGMARAFQEGVEERMAERWWDPDLEYVEDPKWPGSTTHRGRDSVVRAFEGYREVLGGDVHVEEVMGGPNGVFALLAVTGRSAGAEVPWEQRWAYHCRTRDGKLVYFRAYLDPDEARRDAGLSSSP
jgi:ketosteroid isomerase-like protein